MIIFLLSEESKIKRRSRKENYLGSLEVKSQDPEVEELKCIDMMIG